MALPSKSQLKRLRDKKIEKYQWVPEILARMLVGRMPKNTKVEFDELYAAGLEELVKQMDRLYTDDKLVKRLYSDKKKDLTVGPFFLKGLKDPYIKKSDSGSIKYIKGAILDVMRDADPAPPSKRAELKKINKFKNDYFVTLGRYPRRKVIKEKFKISDKKLDDLLSYEE